MDIFLIRHGNTYHSSIDNYNPEKNGPDPSLTEKGINQADRLGKTLKKGGIEKIYSSDFIRAIQTANIINGYINCEIAVDKRLREINMGRLHISKWDKEFYEEWKLNSAKIPYPDGESGNDAWDRYRTFIDEVISSDASRIAIITHGGAIRVMICGVLGISQNVRLFFGNPLENCSISIIRYSQDERKFYLHSFNDNSILIENENKS